MFNTFILAYTSIATTVLLALVVLFIRNRSFEPGMMILKYYFVFAAIVDLIALACQLNGINNLALINVFCLVRFLVLSITMSFWMHNDKRIKPVQFTALIVTIGMGIYVFADNVMILNSVVLGAQNILLVILSAIVLVRITGDHERYLIHNYKFWISVAVFIYFSVSTFVFTTVNLVIDDHLSLQRYTWNIHSVLGILANLIYIKGILCLPQIKN